MSGPALWAPSLCVLLARCPLFLPLPQDEAGLTWGPERPHLEPEGCRALRHQPGLCHQLLGKVTVAELLIWPPQGPNGG